MSNLATAYTTWLFNDTSAEPDIMEIREASSASSHVVCCLQCCHDQIKEEFPERTDALSAINRVLDALREEHGGVLPHILFKEWVDARIMIGFDRQWQTPEERKTLVETLRRWQALKASFDKDKLHEMMFFENNISEVARYLQGWLKERYGQT